MHTGESLSSRNISPLHVKKKKILWNIFRASLERELFLLERVFFKSVLVVNEEKLLIETTDLENEYNNSNNSWRFVETWRGETQARWIPSRGHARARNVQLESVNRS